MANTIHTVMNIDDMSGTKDQSLLVSLKYFDENDEPAEIDNGSIVEVGDYLDGSREVRKATAPTASTPISKLAVIANPEVIYDESRQYGLEEYVNAADKVVRGYKLHSNDGYSVTKEGFNGVPSKGKYVVVGDTTKYEIADSATGTVIGKIDDVWTLGRYTFYYIQVSL